MKTRFLATMSHDIRTPLNGIIGMVNMGNQYADDPQMQQKIREKVMESLKYLVSLVNDVLDMNKLQSGDLKDQQLLFDLTMALRELNQIYDERAAKKGIRYEIDWKNGKYSHSALVGNPVYLGRILSNIMDNAIKFSQAGSVLTVGVKEETLDEDRSISVLSYNLETLLAEKMQTILARGLANTRMRDFYDVYEIMNSKADQISFDVLKKAFAATCMKRETSFGEEEVRETLDKIKDDSGLEEMWNRFKRVNYFVDDLPWGEVSETIVDNIEKISFFSDQVSWNSDEKGIKIKDREYKDGGRHNELHKNHRRKY